MFNKIKKKVSELFGSSNEVKVSEQKKIIKVEEKEITNVKNEKVMEKVSTKSNTNKSFVEEKIKSSNPKSYDSKRDNKESSNNKAHTKNTRSNQGKDFKSMRESGPGKSKYSDTRGNKKPYNKNRRDDYGKKNYSSGNRRSEIDNRPTLEKKLSSWIEEGLRKLTEGSVVRYEEYSMEIKKRNTIGLIVKMNDTEELKVSFDEILSILGKANNIDELEVESIENRVNIEYAEKKIMIIKSIFHNK